MTQAVQDTPKSIDEICADESLRNETFPITRETIYLSHAGVCPLPRVAEQGLNRYAALSTTGPQEFGWIVDQVAKARALSAKIIGGHPDEIALLGPTSLGTSLVANGLDWEPGDEVLFYQDDYPANVYPWTNLEARGVKPVPIRTATPGAITWDTIEPLLTKRTRLVALATCNFLSGYRIDVDAIGRRLQERNILFSLDAIQTVGAFPTSVEFVDFLSADSHKWMLGPAAAGIFYVKKSRQPILRPTLLGFWNVISPDFVAQDRIEFHDTAQRYEPGMLNLPGIVGMTASLELLLGFGVDQIAQKLLLLRTAFLDGLRPLGYRLYTEEFDLDPHTTDDTRSAIMSFTHPDRDMKPIFLKLNEENIVASLRRNRDGHAFLRLSPHFYNTLDEVGRVVELFK